MLKVLGKAKQACDGLSRREAMQVGGLSLFSGMTLPHLLQASENSGLLPTASADSIILINLFGGPPHQDMVDLKPNAPDNVRSIYKPISTAVPGLQICEKMPKIAGIMDRATLIRTYSHRYNSHNPYNVLTGYDGGSDRENYFAKITDHPSMAAVCQHLGQKTKDVPFHVLMPAFPGYSQSLRRAGPYGAYLGSQYDPLFTTIDATVPNEDQKGDYEPQVATGTPKPPTTSSDDLTVDRLNTRKSLLGQLDDQLSRIERKRTVARLDKFRDIAFQLLTSSNTRSAFDISKETDDTRKRYGDNVMANSALIARRLVEAGSKFITLHWEVKGNNHWDLHGNVFKMLDSHLPQLDQFVEALVLDLEERGLLDRTLVVVMGEMGRTPTINKQAGRDHWPQCGFSLLFGGGMKKGCVIGSTDKHAAYPTDRPVSAGDLAATIYHVLGVDSRSTVPDLENRPIHISHGGTPVFEAIS